MAGAFLAAAAAAYYLFHTGYLATPSEDYLGNILPFSTSILSLQFGDILNKLLPAYPALIAALSTFFGGHDPVLSAALVLNMALLVPYFAGAYLIFSKFLSRQMTAAALFFLAANSYTLYTALNPELEIFLATATLWTFVLLSRGSRFDLVTAAVVAVTKWDSVFIVPAVLWKRFFPGLRWKRAFVAGVIASLPFVVWTAYLFLMKLRDPDSSNVYVSEIARRGPNIYRYLIDAYLVPSGFVQWAGLDVYASFPSAVSILIAVAAVLFAVLFLALLAAGIRSFVRTQHELRAPLAVYIGGFVLIHMVYQNTKDKYVLPIVWFLTLLVFIGLERWLIPVFVRAMKERAKRLSVIALSAFLFAVSVICVVRTHETAIAAFFAILSSAWLVWLYSVPGVRGKVLAAAALFSLFVIGMDVVYGRTILDHYSRRRVEFKLAGEWLRDNMKPGDVIVASEETVLQYYSGIPMSDIYMFMHFPSRDLESLDLCLSAVGAKYLYIDDFYIRRLVTNDKNALDRKAPLVKKLKSVIDGNPRFTLVKTIHVDPDINGRIYMVKDQ